jgi:hypothetical protein
MGFLDDALGIDKTHDHRGFIVVISPRAQPSRDNRGCARAQNREFATEGQEGAPAFMGLKGVSALAGAGRI